MPHAVSSAAPGLQAVILCGPGSSFPTFTSNPDENPKALLSIANRPMVWYALDFCYRAGITDITLICPPSAEKAILSALNINPFLTSLPWPRPMLLAPKSLDFNTGTAQILRLPEVKSTITKDFVVLPCDLVCDLGGEKLLQAWMVKSASLSDLLGNRDTPDGNHSGGLGVWYQTKTATPVKGLETDFIATTPLPSSPMTPKGSLTSHVSKLVFSMPTDTLTDLTEERSGFPTRQGLLRKHPRVKMLTSHRDAHIYIFPRWIMDFVENNERLDSIGEDVIGWWAKAGWQPGLAEKLGIQKILRKGDAQGIFSSANDGSESPTADSEEMRRISDTPNLTTPASNAAIKHLVHTSPTASTSEVIPPILAYIHPTGEKAPLIRRVDTAQLLLQISLELAKLESIEEVGAEAASPFAHARKVAYPEGVKSRTTITRPDSLVADNVTVDEKVSIKETVVGANCQIKEGAKLLQCVLMDGVVVGKGCRLTRCILGKRSEVGEGCNLMDCEVQENLLVEPRTEDKGAKLMSSSGLEATEAEMQEAYQDFEDDNDEVVIA